ncbi:MAG: c-type cytochrome biogenesis protein CcsB [Syntrophothermus sp.]
MLILSERFLQLAAVSLWASLAVYVARFKAGAPRLAAFGGLLAKIGWVALTLSILARAFALGHAPLTTFYESLTALVLGALTIYLYLDWKWQWPVLSAFFLLFASVGLAYAMYLPQEVRALPPMLQMLPPVVRALPPRLQSGWLLLHVTFNFFSYGAFTLSFLIGIQYLWQEYQLKHKKFTIWYDRLPSLDRLEFLNERMIQWGFPLLTVGIITGAVWAKYAWGNYWDWNAKETWSLFTWLIFALALYFRHIKKWRGRKAVLFTVIGFLAVLFNYFGINFLASHPHFFIRGS